MVPDEFPGILKNFTKEVIRNNPENMATYARQYFEELLRQKGYFEEKQREKMEFNAKEFYLSHNEKFKDFYELG